MRKLARCKFSAATKPKVGLCWEMNRMTRNIEYYEKAYTGELDYRFLEKRFMKEIFSGL